MTPGQKDDNPEHIKTILQRVIEELRKNYSKSTGGRPCASMGGAPITPPHAGCNCPRCMETGLHRRHVQRTLKRLMERNIVASKGYSKIITYQFQKDYLKWKDVAYKGSPAPVEATDRSLKRRLQKKITKAKELSGKKIPDSRIKQFEDFWGETFQKETGQPYAFSFAKEGKLIKDLLAVHSLELLQDMTRFFFRDERCRQRGLDIGIFKMEFNRLIGMRAMDPLEQAKRELGKKNLEI
jgi:hypothetical protein